MSVHNGPARIRHIFAALVVIAGLAAASEPAEAQAGVTTYYACYVPGSGTVYRIKAANAPAACSKRTHIEFQWTDFVRAIDPVIATKTVTVPPGLTGGVSVDCPIGSIAYTGGFGLSSVALKVTASRPTLLDDMRRWVVLAYNESGTPQELTAFARCVRP